MAGLTGVVDTKTGEEASMSPINVVVHGALGRVGKEMVKGVIADPDIKLVGAVDIKANGSQLTEADTTVPLSTNLEEMIDTVHPEVIIDFTLAKAAMPARTGRPTAGRGSTGPTPAPR